MRRILPLVLLAMLFGAACSGAGQTATGAAASLPRSGGATTDLKGVPATGVGAEQGIPTLAAPGRDLILTANVAMRSDDPWQTADSARAIARGLGGSIISLSESGSGEKRSASLVMRVPAGRFDDFVTELKKLDGEVQSSSIDAKDVTDQLVDLDARLVAMRAEEARYIQLFASAKTVDEMLKVQAALSQLRIQIEQLAAQQKSTKDRVEFSTVTLSVAPIAVPVPAEPLAKWDPARTFAAAATALAALFRVVADLAIWLLVFGWIPLVTAGLLYAATRGRRRPAAA